ncbi:MAG: hypothetical protein QOD32_1757 [Pyrinomonadaceae bacterium]|jgi:hypothetical protein|nr:hypothetical protein [Pyrinomonadaceae bacterium]
MKRNPYTFNMETPPVIFEIARSHERTDIFSLPEGSDVTVELYGGAVMLRLEGELRRVHFRRFDHVRTRL